MKLPRRLIRRSKVRKVLGQRGEKIAGKHLERKGYRILEQNLKNKIGEVDILCQDGGTLVLVEVKTRKSTDFGQAQEKVDWKKQKKLLLLARSLAQNYNCNDIRIDVVGVDLTGPRAKVEHIVNAVEEN